MLLLMLGWLAVVIAVIVVLLLRDRPRSGAHLVGSGEYPQEEKGKRNDIESSS